MKSTLIKLKKRQQIFSMAFFSYLFEHYKHCRTEEICCPVNYVCGAKCRNLVNLRQYDS